MAYAKFCPSDPPPFLWEKAGFREAPFFSGGGGEGENGLVHSISMKRASAQKKNFLVGTCRLLLMLSSPLPLPM